MPVRRSLPPNPYRRTRRNPPRDVSRMMPLGSMHVNPTMFGAGGFWGRVGSIGRQLSSNRRFVDEYADLADEFYDSVEDLTTDGVPTRAQEQALRILHIQANVFRRIPRSERGWRTRVRALESIINQNHVRSFRPLQRRRVIGNAVAMLDHIRERYPPN